MVKLLKEIKETGILPGSYFPSRYYPKTLATELPQVVVNEFKAQVEEWLDYYPQDAGTEFYANLVRIAGKV